MALFKRNFNKPGPGVPKNAPRKRGFARFFEILGRDFSNLMKLNLFYQLCVLPAQAFLLISIFNIGSPLFLLFAALALVCSIPVGPANTALSLCISKMLRDDPGFAWHDFKKAFKENFRPMALPGVIYALIMGAQLYAAILYLFSGQTFNIILIAVFLFSILLFYMAAPYFFLQAAYLDLGVGALLKNSLLLALGKVPRSFMGALLWGILMAAQVAVFPLAIPVTVLIGYSLPLLLNLMWIWPPVDETFKIEKTLAEREKGRLDEALDGPGTAETTAAEERTDVDDPAEEA